MMKKRSLGSEMILMAIGLYPEGNALHVIGLFYF